MTKDQIIIILLILMAVVLTAELLYILVKKKRRKEEIKMFRKPGEPVETMADKAHNAVITAESISATLERQGVDTGEADALISQAKRSMAARDYSAAIERTEAAKLVLLRAKKDHETRPRGVSRADSEPAPRPAGRDVYEPEPVPRDERSLDSLPANYVQSKFMLSTVKDLLDKRGISSGQAYEFYSSAVNCYRQEDYTRALSQAIKAERLLDSGNLSLIGEEKPADGGTEIYVCPGCDSEVAQDDAFCRECGQKLAAAECPKCGTEYDSNDKFCRKCGQKLR